MLELGPILRALLHNKGRFWLITVEIALTMAIVVNCAMLMLGQYRQMSNPSGMDEENILVVTSRVISQDLKQDKTLEVQIQEDLRILRGQQGVIAATAMSAIPLSGGGSSTGRRPVGSEIDTQSTPYFTVRSDATKALDIGIIAGRNLVESDFPPQPEYDDEGKEIDMDEEEEIRRTNILATKHYVDKLFPDGDGLGKEIANDEETSIWTIVGIIDEMQCSWPTSSVADDVILYPSRPGSERRVAYFVRTEPNAVEDLYKGAEDLLVASNEGRLINVETLAEIKADTFQSNVAMMKLISGVVVLLFAVTSLGIVGLTSFSVTQRYRQIGTRRALGATRSAILRYFLVENWVITGIALAIGLGLSFAVNQALVAAADAPKLEWGILGGSLLLFWFVGFLAALMPAMRGMKVSPVIATRTV